MSLVSRRLIYTTAASLSAGTLYYISKPPSTTKKMLPTYEATFSVPLECDACIKDISSALEKLPGKHIFTLSVLTSTESTDYVA